ncbi:Uncharacterised protein [Candidatus Anstonella stagnisolia]|nr:Uncharacterised protein [Candidatus Anstonella stagnisolia]
MDYEYETVKATFNGIAKEQKRYILSWTTEKGEDKKYSAFEPLFQLADLKMGKTYEFEVVHIPTKDDPQKSHHNMNRVAKDKEFKIKPLEGVEAFVLSEPVKQGQAKEIPQSVWDKKDMRISRLAVLNTATAIIGQSTTKYTDKEFLMAVKVAAAELEEWVNRTEKEKN